MKKRRAFTLIELLVVISVIGALMAILLPVLGRAKESARSTACKSRLRQISMASHMYTQDYDGYFAKSNHSAATVGCLRWGPAFMPYLGAGRYQGPTAPSWQNVFKGIYHCPSDKRKPLAYSYGKNVWFELTSNETGGVLGLASGPTYQTMMQVRHPAATVEFGELGQAVMGDHMMAENWLVNAFISEPGPEVDKKRHIRMANYSYVDGHILTQEFKETFDIANPDNVTDNWNPGTARN